MEEARNKNLVDVEAQRAGILPYNYAGKIQCPGVQTSFLLENQHFIFGRW